MQLSGNVDNGPRNKKNNFGDFPDSRATLILPKIKAKIKCQGTLSVKYNSMFCYLVLSQHIYICYFDLTFSKNMFFVLLKNIQAFIDTMVTHIETNKIQVQLNIDLIPRNQ